MMFIVGHHLNLLCRPLEMYRSLVILNVFQGRVGQVVQSSFHSNDMDELQSKYN